VSCKRNFEIKGDNYSSNHLLLKLLEEKVFLSNEETDLKQKIEACIRVFFQIFEEFLLNKTNLELACHNHFSEIRSQTDLHRERLKDKIDDIALEMIDQTNKFEDKYLKSLKQKLGDSLILIETKTCDEELKDIEDKFRDPNLLIESIRQLQLEK